MKHLAEGVWQLSGFPPNAINVFLVEDVLVDAGARFDTPRIIKGLRGHGLSAHVLTHAHADHQGASKAVCERFGVPFWAPERDADAAEDPRLILERQPDALINKVFWKAMVGPGHPVDRRLREGDEVAGFSVLDTPGHSAGHISLWRESDRTLICGDVVNTADPLTLLPGLREPKTYFTPDPARNRESIRRLGELEPALVLVGHGPPFRDTRKFVEFARGLPG